jgi:hypothetical protein
MLLLYKNKSKKIEKTLIRKSKKTEKTLIRSRKMTKTNNTLEKLKKLSKQIKYPLLVKRTIKEQESNQKKEIIMPNYPTFQMKKIAEEYITVEAKGTDKENRFPAGIKESKTTHHAFSNIPIPTTSVYEDQKKANSFIFYPVETLNSEYELITKPEIKTNAKNAVIERVYIYYDIIKNKALTIKIQKITISKELYEKLKEEHKDEILLIKHIKLNKDILNKDAKNVFLKEEIIDEREILDEIKIKKEKNDNKETTIIEYINNEGEVFEKEIEKKRVVGKYIFGVGVTDLTKKWKKTILPIKVFTRKDLATKKGEDFYNNLKLVSNQGKLKVNYDNLYLNGLPDIEKYPHLFVFATATNKSGHEFGILLPIAKSVENKWQPYERKEILKALMQVKQISIIKIKVDDKEYEIDLLLRKKPLITEIKEIGKCLIEKLEKVENISPPTDLMNQVEKDVRYYKILQRIKEYIDRLDPEEIEELKKEM